MAFIDSIRSYHIKLANIDADVYLDLRFKMVRYEGEAAAQVFLRLVSFIHSYRKGYQLASKDDVWVVENTLLEGDPQIVAIVGVPEWKRLDHDLRKMSMSSGKRADPKKLSLYLSSMEDYQQLLHRVKSRRLNGIEYLQVFTPHFDKELIDDEALIKADSWDVLILDDQLLQLSITTGSALREVSGIIEKREIWDDYQTLLQELSRDYNSSTSHKSSQK